MTDAPAGDPGAADALREVGLTIARNEPEAEVICGVLRADGIRCVHRITNMGFGSGGELPSSGGGPRQVLVHAENLERARALLASYEQD